MTLLVVLLLASFLPSFTGSSLNVAISVIGKEFPEPAATLGWLVTAFTICAVTMALPLGRLGDLTSRRAVMMFGLALFAVANLITFFVTSMQMLIVMRVLQGLGGACMISTNQAILSDSFPPAVRGRMLGINTAAIYIGLAVGPILSGVITAHLGWRMIFIFIAAWATVTFFLAIGRLPKNTQSPSTLPLYHRLDIPGMLLFMVGMLIFTFGLNHLPGTWIDYLLIAGGVILLVIFLFWENHSKIPLLNLNLFRANRSFGLSTLTTLLNYGATFAVSYLMSIYLQQVKGFTPDITGLIMITAPVVQSLVTIVAGRLSDRYSPFRLASMGCGVCTIALISFIFVTPESPLIHIILNLVIVGTGFGLFSSPNVNAIMSMAPRADLGLTAALLGTMRNMGQVISMTTIALVMVHFLQDRPIGQVAPAEITAVTQACFIIFAGICLVGVFTSLQYRSRKNTPSSAPEANHAE